MSGNFDASGFVQGALARSDAGVIQSWWRSFLEEVVLPNAEVFSFLVMWGETLVGLALLLGAFTAFAAFIGILMNISFLLSGAVGQNLIFIILGLVLIIGGTNAGRYGIDQPGSCLLCVTKGMTGQPETAKDNLYNKREHALAACFFMQEKKSC